MHHVVESPPGHLTRRVREGAPHWASSLGLESHTKLCGSGPAHHCQSLIRRGLLSPRGSDEPGPADPLHPANPARNRFWILHFHLGFLPPVPRLAFVTPAASSGHSDRFGRTGSRAGSRHGASTRHGGRPRSRSRLGDDLQGRHTRTCCTRLDASTRALPTLIQCTALPDEHLPELVATSAGRAGAQGSEERTAYSQR